MNDTLKMTWKGKILEEMTKEELIQAFHELAVMYKDMENRYTDCQKKLFHEP
mgnify:CR=1 FL=1